MTNVKRWISLLLLSGLAASCMSTQQGAKDNAHPPVKQNVYTAAYPHFDVSQQLKQAQQSVVRVVATGIYKSYTFTDRLVTLDDIKVNTPQKIASSSYEFEESTAGTSIILQQNNNNYLLISSEHVVSFPDTVISYYKGKNIPDRKFVKAISIRKDQTHLAYTGKEIKSFEIITRNEHLDLALLNIDLENNKNIDQYPLSLTYGNSSDLQLGSFLYIIGFPKGYAMTTRGLASSSESWNDRFFVTDAIFNPGISGGLIMASRDNFNSFEWVGMVSSATATREDVLIPRPTSDDYSNISRPYRDTVFVQQKTRINYGIAQAIPINRIKEFLTENEDVIKSYGFSLSKYLASH